MTKKAKAYIRKMLKNKKGFNLIELSASIGIAAVLMSIIGVGAVILLAQARIAVVASDLNNYNLGLTQATIENPKILGGTEEETIKYINSFLDPEYRFGSDSTDTATYGISTKLDQWKNPYKIFFNPEDNAATPIDDPGTTDTEARIFIVSGGKNSKITSELLAVVGKSIPDDTVKIEKDDLLIMIQDVNGFAKTASYGLKENKGPLLFDTGKELQLINGYCK